jgi:pimeloyl-ACP methyl ester carboxylesterase
MAFEGEQITRSLTKVAGFRDPEFDYQLLRAIGLADYGGSSVGECLGAAAHVMDGDTASWVSAFRKVAERVEQRADTAFAHGHLVSARDHYLRASTYYRTAEYYAETDVVAMSEIGQRGSACFDRAAGLLAPRVERITVPYAASTGDAGGLPGYLVTPTADSTADGRPIGTMVAMGDFDSNAEELYFRLGKPGVERGWQVLLFDGPGQSACMRRSPALTYRPDYEVPVGAVLDYVAGRADARPERLVLVGLGFGGYFAGRAAAFDSRVGGLVVSSPIFDLYRYLQEFLGTGMFDADRDLRPEDVTGVPADLLPKQIAWGIVAACRRFGVRSFQDWKRYLAEFRLGADVARITVPALALVGQHEGPEMERQVESLVSGASGPVTLERFGLEGGADAHCQVGNLRLAAQVTFDWLDRVFAPEG